MFMQRKICYNYNAEKKSKFLTVSKSTFSNIAYFCLQIVISKSCKKYFHARRAATKGGILLSLLHFKLISM